MSKKDTYYGPEDLKKFGSITEFQKEFGEKYFGSVFQEGALTIRQKALIALAVAHVESCPYCIDSDTADCIKKGQLIMSDVFY